MNNQKVCSFVYHSLSHLNVLTTFTAEAGIKWTRKWQWSYLNFKLFVSLFDFQNHSCNSNIIALLKGLEIMLQRYYIRMLCIYTQLGRPTLVVHVIFTYGKSQTVQIYGIIIKSQSKIR